MRKYNLTQAKVYVYDKATAKMVEKKKLSADNEIKLLEVPEGKNLLEEHPSIIDQVFGHNL